MRNLLWIDCTACALAGVTVLTLSGWLSHLHAVPRELLLVIGVVNVLYACYSFALATRTRRSKPLINLLVSEAVPSLAMRPTVFLISIMLAALVAGCASSDAPRIEERTDFAGHFQEAGVTGTFVLYDPAERRYLVHDLERAREQFIPASTFKVMNSLVFLEIGVVADTTAVFEWDGVERDIPQWNRDHTLATAYENSVVWAYQELARRVGEDRMREYVQRVGYGNGDIGGGIDQFWLTGDLRISPMEQVEFLRQLHERGLPFSDRTVDLVEGMMIEDRGPGYVLRAKTGWARWQPADVGWYVGYVVRGDRPYYFALNMDIERPEQGAARRAVARAILRDLELL